MLLDMMKLGLFTGMIFGLSSQTLHQAIERSAISGMTLAYALITKARYDIWIPKTIADLFQGTLLILVSGLAFSSGSVAWFGLKQLFN